MRLFPRERWLEVSDVLIFHGRRVCHARRPRCEECAVADICPSSLLRPARRRARVRDAIRHRSGLVP